MVRASLSSVWAQPVPHHPQRSHSVWQLQCPRRSSLATEITRAKPRRKQQLSIRHDAPAASWNSYGTRRTHARDDLHRQRQQSLDALDLNQRPRHMRGMQLHPTSCRVPELYYVVRFNQSQKGSSQVFGSRRRRSHVRHALIQLYGNTKARSTLWLSACFSI